MTAMYRLGSVPYLNARPLVRAIRERGPEWGLDLTEEVPSRLAEGLESGRYDAALVSSIACLASPGLCILPDISITTHGPSVSGLLFCKESPEAVRRLALDVSSRSTVALGQIIMRERFGVAPEPVPSPPDLDAMLDRADAAVMIGDPAMTAHADGLLVLDLGALWHELTGEPFVFAVWAAPRSSDLGRLPGLLIEAKHEGLAQLETIAQEEARRLGLPLDLCRRYLCEVMRYDLGDAEIAGLDRFRQLAIKHGLVSATSRIAFYGDQ
jgi:chorismate dehydratase